LFGNPQKATFVLFLKRWLVMDKRGRLSLLLFWVGILLCTGCKGEDGMDTVSDVPFVVNTEEGITLLNSVNFNFYSEKIAELPEAVDGACGVGTFSVDFSKYIDAKYYTADAKLWTWLPFSVFTMAEELNPVATDTISLAKGCNVIGQVLFLLTTQEKVEGQEYAYRLNYNLLDTIANNNYQFNLSVSQLKEVVDDKPSKKEKVFLAFNLADFFKRYDMPEKADTFNLGVKFCKGWTEEGLYVYDLFKITPAIIRPL
jgi:hypothetical protein